MIGPRAAENHFLHHFNQLLPLAFFFSQIQNWDVKNPSSKIGKNGVHPSTLSENINHQQSTLGLKEENRAQKMTAGV